MLLDDEEIKPKIVEKTLVERLKEALIDPNVWNWTYKIVILIVLIFILIFQAGLITQLKETNESLNNIQKNVEYIKGVSDDVRIR